MKWKKSVGWRKVILLKFQARMPLTSSVNTQVSLTKSKYPSDSLIGESKFT